MKKQCSEKTKIIGLYFISKYMVKKYGFEEAIKRKLKIKTL